VDKDGKIPSGKQVSDIQEELRVAYFNSLTSDNPPEPVSSEDEATKAERLDILATARTNKLLKFHPMELYIYLQFGPASVGGSASPCFLESAPAIQKAMKAGECSNREELRKRNNKELLDKAHTKKAMKLLANTVEEMEECDPTTSFREAYGKQLQLEESREQRENTRLVAQGWRAKPAQRGSGCLAGHVRGLA